METAKRLFLLLFALFALVACNAEDRADEQPFAPTVRTLSAVATGDSCVMEGVIASSPNSNVTGRGFYYGNDTLRVQVVSYDTLTATFREIINSIAPGDYYVYAFATNGMGTRYGDTLTFRISAEP